MTLTKTDMVDLVQKRIGFSRNTSTEVIETLIETMKDTIESGDDVLISGFGKFCVKQKKQRKGRNPSTGKDMMLSPRQVVTFKCSSILRDKVK